MTEALSRNSFRAMMAAAVRNKAGNHRHEQDGLTIVAPMTGGQVSVTHGSVTRQHPASFAELKALRTATSPQGDGRGSTSIADRIFEALRRDDAMAPLFGAEADVVTA